jgi:ATPase subunit of ABC transporter with duplicated ATPase domains
MGLEGLVREFVAKLDSVADGVPSASGTGRQMRQEYRYCQSGLMELAGFAEKRETDLFNLLLEAQREGVLADLSCSISLKNGDTIAVDDLSEGEKQLLLVMGMLRFAEHDEALFLLDEPDTHLNPRWSLSYVDMIERELGHAPKSHIIMATHDPLVLTNLKASQVRILRRGPGAKPVAVSAPYSDPKEMGVDGLLTSELFDLSAPIGTEVQEMIYRRAVLLGKSDQRTEEETREMQNITQRLDRMGFAKVFADPIYTKFVAAMGKRPEFMKPVLSPEEMAEQERFASEVLDEIMKEDSR